MKKAIVWLITLILLLEAMPLSAFAADSATDYLRLEVQLERGSVTYAYDFGYSRDYYRRFVRTAFDVKTGGADKMSVEKFAASHGPMYIQFFGSDYIKISSVAYTDEAIVDVPDGCDFIRIEINTQANLETIGLRFYGAIDRPYEAKRAGKNETSEKLTYKVSDDLFTTSRLILPPNYTIDGDKVPLILWLEGSGSSLSSWDGDFNSNKLPFLRYLRDEGFAVFSVYAWGNQYAEQYPKCGNSFPYPTPTNLACIKAGIEYICSRYNIDADNLHIMSKSQGGQCALYYASNNELNAKSIGMFAPVLDYLSMPGEAMYADTRAAIADDLDFTGDVEYFASDRFLSYSDEGRAFLYENLDQLMTLNEAWTNLSGATPEELFESSMDDCETFWTEQIWKTDRTDIYTHTEYVKTATVPVKIWGAKDDAATPYLKMVEVVEQLKNGGSIAVMRTLPAGTGGHSCADIGSTRVDVTTALGIEHKNVPIGWVENVAWIRAHSSPEHSHTYENGECTSCGAAVSWEGKSISILGDSISTYTGISNDSTVNATLSGGSIYYGEGALGGYQQTWWQQTIDALDMRLLVNNSWSGSCVLNTRAGTVGAYIDRCVQLHNDRTGEQPDAIAVFLGTNDFSYFQSTLGTAAIDYAALITDCGDGTFAYATPTTTCEAYAIMLHKMTRRYPDAAVYCLSMLSRRDPDSDGKDVVPAPTAFNAELKAIIERFGATYVDMESIIPAEASEFDKYMGDKRVHPNNAGMDKMTEAVVGTMLQRPVSLSNISYTLRNVSCDKTPATILKNEAFDLSLTVTEGAQDMTVRVTMDGEDITADCYADGRIHIADVTGDVAITATAARTPSTYRWQFSDGELVSAGDTANPLTKLAGTTEENVFQSTRYRLSTAVELIHTRPWVIEWKGEGRGGFMLCDSTTSTDSPYFFRRDTNFLNAFGDYDGTQYNNYGVALSNTAIDGSANHTYRLENRIFDDGTNMVYLLVDGTEIGALDNYFVGGSPKNSKGNWLSGTDFVFSYIGSTSHPLTRYAMEYLSIDECVHTYENGVCTACGEKDPNPYAGKTIACIGDSITAGVGVTKDQTDYVTLLANSLEMDYIRLGASGTTLCTDGHATCNISKLTEADLANADVVTILMGINDFVQARNNYYRLGTIDSTDTSTIYGAVHMWCQKIEELREKDSLKDTEFYFMTPVITSWNNSVSTVRNWDQSKTNIYGYTLRDLCNAIIEVCALYDIPVIDLNLISGLYYNSTDDNTVVEFGGDGAHPGTVGHQMMADAIKKALLQNHLNDGHNHIYGSWITTIYPSCEDGEQQRVCSICTATEKQILEGLGHTYENGVCTGCGAQLSPGDINADGAVNNRDLGLLQQYLNGWDVTVDALAADLNGDGVLNNRDLALLQRHLNGWEGIL